ncbi:cupin domain-containing protein [Candidatus Thiosymbion oneisti]|uniref:cupin domain-containing protein n=1 Tax=Candidatus Thiosymbion oneisti TaxID=589554 RepID=UPI0013FDD997|nr:cupin domain-containing protein [Candidatus Thiosymbion oneisti]
MKLVMYFVIGLFLAACQSRDHVKLIYPDKIYEHTEWTEDELKQDIAIRHLHRGTDSSTHLVRLTGKESPHFHDRHDLTVSVISGTSIIHFKNHAVSLLPGDVIYIPKGILHWAENTDPVASVVFAVFSPAFDGKDRRKAE